jgi:class 3 adenylate cyclase
MTTAMEELDSVVKRLGDQQRELVKKFATAEVAEDLEESGFALGGKFIQATVMFSDIRGFTTITESQSPSDTIELLNACYTLMFEAISGHGGVVNQMVGDGLIGEPILVDEITRNGLSETIGITDQGSFKLKDKVQEVHIFSIP